MTVTVTIYLDTDEDVELLTTQFETLPRVGEHVAFSCLVDPARRSVGVAHCVVMMVWHPIYLDTAHAHRVYGYISVRPASVADHTRLATLLPRVPPPPDREPR